MFASNSVPEFTPTDKREEKMMKKKIRKEKRTQKVIKKILPLVEKNRI